MSADRGHPWDHPGKLWSLLDLVEKYAVGELLDLHSFVCSFNQYHKTNPIAYAPDQVDMLRSKFSRYAEIVRSLDLNVSAYCAREASDIINNQPLVDGCLYIQGQVAGNLSAATRTIVDVLGKDMEGKLFLMLPRSREAFFDQPRPLFGADVADAFPEAAEDISEAGKCFALSRFTASIFHLMRAIESAMQVIGPRIGAAVQDADGKGLPWGVIARNMKDKIDRLPKGSDEQVRWYRAHSFLEVLNRAWRAPTAHPKQTYTAEEAEAVMNAAKSFMQELTPFVEL